MTQININKPGLNKGYMISTLLFMFILPALCILYEWLAGSQRLGIALIGKWFIFWGIGLRLFTAGLKQAFQPEFTARNIFHLTDSSTYPVVRELGYANICFGAVGLLSLFFPEWRIVSAFASGLFYGIAGVNHIVKKPAGANEMVALVTDVVIFLILLIYVVVMF